MPDRAIAEFQGAEAVSGGMTRLVAGLGRAYAAAGKRDQARKVLAQLTAESRRGYVSWYELCSTRLSGRRIKRFHAWIGRMKSATRGCPS